MGGSSDSADSPDTVTTTVTVTVLDVNDERPTFSANQVSASVDEELPAGRLVTMESTLRVTDPDQVIIRCFLPLGFIMNEDDRK